MEKPITVKELIELLKDYPQDYPVTISSNGYFYFLSCIGVDLEEKTVDLFHE